MDDLRERAALIRSRLLSPRGGADRLTVRALATDDRQVRRSMTSALLRRPT
jgi:hypothetical protein